MTFGSVSLAKPSLEAGSRSPLSVRTLSIETLVAILPALVWLLGHAFVGNKHDGYLYIGRVLADLDPGGVGRDPMFVLDGQTGLTVFRPFAAWLVATFGLGPASIALALINIVVWFAAMAVFVRTIVVGRAWVLILTIACLLPRFYTPWHLISAGESYPVPRPLAEAAVLLAMAALCRRRMLVCLTCLLAAALFHPIMAAPGFAIVLVFESMRDRRWLLVAAFASCAIVAAAVLGVPFLSRLMVTIDPAWRSILVERNPYLFISLWPLDTFKMLIVPSITIVVACLWCVEGHARIVMAAALLTGIAGCLASLLFGDGLGSLLVVQAQLWRAAWLPAALAPVAAGLCLSRLPARGPVGQVVVALLALAWVSIDTGPLAAPVAMAAMVVLLVERRCPGIVGPRSVVATWVACAMLGILCLWAQTLEFAKIIEAKPYDAEMSWGQVWATGLLTVPIAGLAYVFATFLRHRVVRYCAWVTFAVGLVLVATQWYSRSPSQAAADSGRREPALQEKLASRAGTVLWLRGDEIWPWLGRPNWNGETQGGGIVFSRALAFEWHKRTVAMVEHGLADGSMLHPWGPAGPKGNAGGGDDILAADLKGFCRMPDAPAWIVSPIRRETKVPSGLDVWTPGFLRWSIVSTGAGFRWDVYDRYVLVACRGGNAAP